MRHRLISRQLRGDFYRLVVTPTATPDPAAGGLPIEVSVGGEGRVSAATTLTLPRVSRGLEAPAAGPGIVAGRKAGREALGRLQGLRLRPFRPTPGGNVRPRR